eukprot:CAMPEP_0202042650 /NCGR_PEP_ID=MMETSP0962-20130828/27845_1 /ASSEMBLY_ACC=CAM_ASM_000488 /TAXON_ID=4773 /ORGANISM="Schizochytrium aggregatum, Strain ATCC28209" /LENGTH=129 /DNA_ID=CAMNT_0048607067 /DNA_START=34 /DNA_END=418 /DNA_ORIENTATION=+
MNTRKSVAWGWAAFFIAGTTGAFIGWKQVKDSEAANRLRALEQQRRNDEVVARTNARIRAAQEAKTAAMAQDGAPVEAAALAMGTVAATGNTGGAEAAAGEPVRRPAPLWPPRPHDQVIAGVETSALFS